MSKWYGGFGTLTLFYLAAVVSFSACTPRDVQVVSEQERINLGNQNQKGSGKKSDDITVDKEILRLGSHLVARQAEALQMLSWVLDPAGFNKTQDPSLEMHESLIQENNLFRQFKFTAVKKSYANFEATLSGVLQTKISLKVDPEQVLLESAEMTSTGFATYLRINNSKDWLQAIEGERRLFLSRAKDKLDEFDVLYTAEARVKTNKAGKVEEQTLYPYVEMRVRMDRLNKRIEFLSSKGNIRSYDRFNELNLVSHDVVVHFDPCAKMEGTFVITSNSRGGNPAELKAENVRSFTCENSPLLDWGDFLEN